MADERAARCWFQLIGGRRKPRFSKKKRNERCSVYRCVVVRFVYPGASVDGK